MLAAHREDDDQHAFLGQAQAVAQDNLFHVADAEAVYHDIGGRQLLLGDVYGALGDVGHLTVVHDDDVIARDAHLLRQFLEDGAEEVVAVDGDHELRFHELQDQLQILLMRVAGSMDVEQFGVIELVHLAGDVVLQGLHAALVARHDG